MLRAHKGTMQLVERSTGLTVWVYRWFEKDQAGKPKRVKRVIGQFPSEKKAWAEVERLGLGRSLDEFGPRNLKELTDHYTQKELNELQEDGGLAFSTKDTYRYYLRNWIVPRWGSSPLDDIKAVGVEEWLKKLQRTEGEKKFDLAPGSKKKIRDLMHVLFEHAIRHEWTIRNPISSVRQGSKRQSVPQLLTVEELSKLLFGGLKMRERVMVFLGFGSGLRRGELAGLKWGDVDFNNRQIVPKRSIVKQIVGPVKTEESKKAVPLDDYLLNDLLAWRLETPYAADSDYVFASTQKKGKQPFWLSKIMQLYIKPAATDLGIQIKGWHTLRHTYCTLLSANHNDTKVIQELLRHGTYQVTMNTYTQALSENKREAQRGVIRLVVPQQAPRAEAV
jgi:integrase